MSRGGLLALLFLIHALWAGVNKAIEFSGPWLSPTLLAASRWALVAGLVLAALRLPWFRSLTRPKWPGRADQWKCVLLGAGLFGPSHAMYYWAISNPTSPATGTEGTVLLTTAPLWVALLGLWMLGERLDWHRWASILVGLVGAFVVMFGFTLPHMEAQGAWGRAVFLLGVVIESLAFVAITRITRRSSGVCTFALQAVGAAAGLAVLGLVAPAVFPLQASAFSWAALGGVLYLVLVAGLFCWLVLMILTEKQELAFLSLAILLQPPIAAALDAWTGKAIRPETWQGTLIVGFALLLSVSGGRRREAAATG